MTCTICQQTILPGEEIDDFQGDQHHLDPRACVASTLVALRNLTAERDALFCPPHRLLADRRQLAAFGNCIACIRNERDELRTRVAELEAKLAESERQRKDEQLHARSMHQFGKDEARKRVAAEVALAALESL